LVIYQKSSFLQYAIGSLSQPGGVCIKGASGEIIGAIGVSGSSVEDDYAVASAGAAAL